MNNGMGMMNNAMNMMNNGMGMNFAMNPNFNNNMMNNMQNNNMQNMANIMMNNLANMNNPVNNQNMQQQGQQASPQFINIHFRTGRGIAGQNQPQQDGQANEIIIQCNINDKISDIVEKYRTKSLDREEKKFVYNAKNLDLRLTASEAGLVDNATIFVLNTKNVKGA